MKSPMVLVLILGWLLQGAEIFAQGARPRPADWDRIIEAGKKEGKVVVSVPASAELRKDVERVFKQRFGIEAELIAGRAASIVGKIQQEVKAGVYNFDLHMGGSESMVTGLLSEGILEPFEPAMILPEVKDPKNWWGGHIWVDNAKRYIYSSQAYLTENLWYNTEQVKPEEIRSFDDLLNPKWVGKIGYLDPRTAGSGTSIWSFLWKLKGEEYLRKLAGQKMFLSRDQRVLAESLAKGKLAVVIGLTYYSFLPFLKAGLPGEAAPQSARRGLRQRRQRSCDYHQRRSPSQRDQSVHQLVSWQRRTGDLRQGDGAGHPPLRCRDAMAERVRRHRGQRQSDAGPIPQAGESVGGKGRQGARAGGGIRAQAPRVKGRSRCPTDYYNDLREFIDVLDHQGLLYRWQRPVNKDSELMPLMRLQYRGRSDAERQAFLYENVTDGQGRRYGVQSV